MTHARNHQPQPRQPWTPPPGCPTTPSMPKSGIRTATSLTRQDVCQKPPARDTACPRACAKGGVVSKTTSRAPRDQTRHHPQCLHVTSSRLVSPQLINSPPRRQTHHNPTPTSPVQPQPTSTEPQPSHTRPARAPPSPPRGTLSCCPNLPTPALLDACTVQLHQSYVGAPIAQGRSSIRPLAGWM